MGVNLFYRFWLEPTLFAFAWLERKTHVRRVIPSKKSPGRDQSYFTCTWTNKNTYMHKYNVQCDRFDHIEI